jgi:CspA family cold shock protein
MQSGVVKRWDPQRGFGFITTDEGDDLFVHSSDLDVSLSAKLMREGLRVRFDLKSDMKGDKAIRVRRA